MQNPGCCQSYLSWTVAAGKRRAEKKPRGHNDIVYTVGSSKTFLEEIEIRVYEFLLFLFNKQTAVRRDEQCIQRKADYFMESNYELKIICASKIINLYDCLS